MDFFGSQSAANASVAVKHSAITSTDHDLIAIIVRFILSLLIVCVMAHNLSFEGWL